MTSRLAGLIGGAARTAVRLVLLAHPREFRDQFRTEIDQAIAAQIELATARGSLSAVRAAARAVVDAMRGLASPRPPTRHRLPRLKKESPSMRQMLTDALHDARLALRGFVREPGWTAAVVLTLALGIGLNAAMFGVADRLLLSGPEHVRDPEGIGRVQLTLQPPGLGVHQTGVFGYVVYDTLRRSGHSFESIAAYTSYEDGDILGRGADARRINRGEATASLFPLLGVTPAAGRFFTDREDDTVAPERVVVISYDVWQQDFAGRPDVAGQAIVLTNSTYTIVGVTPRGFTGPDLARVDVWYPESLLGRDRIKPNWTQSWNANWLSVIMRLKRGVSAEDAGREVTALVKQAVPPSNTIMSSAVGAVRPLSTSRDGTPSMESRVSVWLFAVAGIVLVVACANVVNLVLARGVRREREIAVRLALGAGRARLVRLLTVESMVLALLGGATGLGVAYLVGVLMRTRFIPSVAWTNGPVNLRVVLVAAVVSLIAGLVVGLIPAWRASRPDVSSSLKTGIREGGNRQGRTRAALTVVQAALSALLLVGSGLFVASLQHVRGIDLGIQPDRVIVFGVTRVPIAPTADAAVRQAEVDRRNAFYPLELERLRQQPEVEAASLTVGLPFWSAFGEDIKVPGLDRIPQLKGGGPFLSAVTADYFKTIGTRILRGRAFTTMDRKDSAPVAIVSELMARTIWPGQDAIGKCFYVNGSTACAEVIGIAAETRRFKLRENEAMAFYIPFGQEGGIGGTSLLVRPRGNATDAIASIRRELLAVDPSITFVSTRVLQDLIEPQIRPWSLGASMFSLMGLLALVVAAVGLYSVMAYAVSQRTHEIGIRMALGARPSEIAALVARGGLALAIAGMTLGFGLALASGRFIEPLLFDTSSRDPRVYAIVALTLVGMAAMATVVPAARARRINPIEAMREE